MDERDLKNAYSKGYAAGKKRLKTARRIENERLAERKRWDATFNAALNGCLAKGGWQMNGKDVTTSDQYIELAKRFADRAVQVYRFKP